jgi:hypothetical protein
LTSCVPIELDTSCISRQASAELCSANFPGNAQNGEFACNSGIPVRGVDTDGEWVHEHVASVLEGLTRNLRPA